MPTVFVGGVGRLFAVDIDPATGLFTRWPENEADFPGPRPQFGAGNPDNFSSSIPPDDPDALRPANPAVPATLQDRPILARTMDFLSDQSRVDGTLVITGGPLQPRGTPPPNPTNDPRGRQVAQNIRDPQTTQEDPTLPTFPYPTIFVTTAGGFLHEISTNTEDEDTEPLDEAAFNESATLGWALTTDPLRKNNRHVLLDTFQGPGGTSGVAVATNAYFPGLDLALENYPATDAPPILRPRPLTVTDDDTGDSGFPLDGNGLFYDPENPANQQGTVQLPFEGPVSNVNPDPDDINPIGSRAVWIFAGGPDGLTYAITPVRLGTGGGGVPVTRPIRPGESDLRATGSPKVDIFTAEDFGRLLDAVRGGTRDVALPPSARPDRDGSQRTGGPTSLAAQGQPNYYEWGDTIYIVAWDLNASTSGTTPGADTVEITATAANGSPVPIIQQTVRLQRPGTNPDPSVPPAFYEYDPAFETQPSPRGQSDTGTPVRLGMAFLEYRLDPANSNRALTPGTPITVRVQQRVSIPTGGPGGGRQRRVITTPTGGPLGRVIRDDLNPAFIIANPFGVQGLFTDTLGNPASVTPTDGSFANQIGPFANTDTNVNIKKNSAAINPVDVDPNQSGAEYDMALANGNTIMRRDNTPLPEHSSERGRAPALPACRRGGSS